jgi:hypothetical protein
MKRIVIVESPFKPTPGRTTKDNIEYGRAALRDSLLRDEAPFASHLLYTLPGILRDGDFKERTMGIEAGLTIGMCADLTAVYADFGISPGMRIGIDRAVEERRKIVFRYLYQ